MATLEVRHFTGDVEMRELNKSHPLSIGSHESNDICVEDEDVGVMHCRIAWNKKAYEVVAAGLDGVEVNGTLVRNSRLKSGDMIRIGSIDILVRDIDDIGAGDSSSSSGKKEKKTVKSSVELKPLTEDEFMLPPINSAGPLSEAVEKSESLESDEYASKSNREDSIYPVASGGKSAPGDLPEDIFEEDDSILKADAVFEGDDEDEEDLSDRPLLSRNTSFSTSQEAGEVAPAEFIPEGEVEPAEPLMTRIKSGMRARARRPGEQDIMQSPLVVGLGGGAVVLLLLAAIFWFIIGRSKSERVYDAAVAEMGQGKYTQAISGFEDFLKEYPQNKLAESARIGLGKSKIEKEISGATPTWAKGLEALQDFVEANRDHSTFEELKPNVRNYAEKIGFGAAKTAEAIKQRSLLAVSADATKILGRYSPSDNPPEELQKEIRAAQIKAEAAILKQETFDVAVAGIDKAIEDKNPMLALDTRRKLLQQYPVFATERKAKQKLAALLAKTLETERQLVTREDLDRVAIAEDHAVATSKPLSLTLHTRSRADDDSAGRPVFAVAKDCCYGIDSASGQPLWRRVIGLDTPFFPIQVPGNSGLLLFDSINSELVLVDQKTGLIEKETGWRQPIDEDIFGAPLVHEGHIYLPTSGKYLYKIDLDSGRVLSRLKFSQPVLAPPVVLSDGKHLVVAGDQEVLYTLSFRQMECASVSFIGHKTASIKAPLIPMGALVLMCENDQADSSRLRVIDASDAANRLSQVAATRIDGQVFDAPVMRGKQLFITSTGERIMAFTVSDDKNQKPLTELASYRVETAHSGPMFLSVGADGQIWMASSVLRRFELRTDSIKLDPKQTAVGMSTQPLQRIGTQFFTGRHMPYSRSVFFSQADGEEMTSRWRTILGAEVLAWTSNAQGSVTCVTESGEVFRASQKELQTGGFKETTIAQLKLPDGLSEPLHAVRLGNDRIAVYCGGKNPTLWIVGPTGLVEQTAALESPLEAPPVLLKSGIVLPIHGKLRLLSKGAVAIKVEDYVAPVVKEKKTRWQHVAVLDENQVLALNSDGELSRIQYRTTPVFGLTQATKVSLENPVDVGFVIAQGRIMLADSAGRLQVLDGSTMEVITSVKLKAPASHSPWVLGDKLYVEVGSTHLVCFQTGDQFEQLWELALDGAVLAGSPVIIAQQLIAFLTNGDILTIDPADGKVKNRQLLGQPITYGQPSAGNSVIAATIDGSLHRIESVSPNAAVEGSP